MSKLTQIIKINEALQKGDQEAAVKLLTDLKKRAKDPAVVKFAEDKLRELGVRDSEQIKSTPVAKNTETRRYEDTETQRQGDAETRRRRSTGIVRDTGTRGRGDARTSRKSGTPGRPYPPQNQGPSRRPFTQKPRPKPEVQGSVVGGRTDVETKDQSPRLRVPVSPHPSQGPRSTTGSPQRKPFKKKPKFKRKPLSPEEMARKEAARNLVNEHKISFTAAYRIVDGTLTLEEYRVRQVELAAKRAAWQEKQRQKEERKSKALKLAEEQNLHPSIAYQIVDGRFTLEEYLKLKELKPKKILLRRRKEGIGAWYFQQLRLSQAPLVFVLYNGQSIVSPLTEIERYDFRLGDQTIPKLHITHCYEAKHAERIKKLVQVNEEAKAKGLTPAVKPIDRYLISDKDLERSREEKSPAVFTTLGGEIIQGIIEWIDGFQIKVNLVGDIWVLVFRHGIQEATFQEGAMEASEQALLQSEKIPIEIPLEKISVELDIHKNARLNPEITGKVLEQTKKLGKIPRPIWVAYDSERDLYVLLDGFRRLTIARELGLTTLPAIVD